MVEVEEERARPENQEVGAGEVIVMAAAAVAVAAAAAARLTGSRRGHRGCGVGWLAAAGCDFLGLLDRAGVNQDEDGNGLKNIYFYYRSRKKFD
jgi:hypothetical protein